MNGVVAYMIVTDNVMAAFQKNNALSAATAKTKSELDVRSKIAFNTLITKGVIKKTSGDKYYLDLENRKRYLLNRNITLVVVCAILVIVALAVVVITKLT